MLRRSPLSPRRRWLLQTIVGLVTLPLSAVPIWIYATHTSVGELLSMRVRYRFMPPSTPQLNPVDRTVADAERARGIRGVPVLFYSIGHPTESIDDHGAGHAIAFAYPYGNWGQNAGPGVARTLRRVVGHRFRLAFDQDQQSGWRPAIPGDDRLHIHRLEVMDWTGPELLKRLDDGAKLGTTVYRERGLDHTYSPLQLVRAAKNYRCAGTSGSVLRPEVHAAHTVSLSFDDGPSPYTPQVLHLLERAHVHATFFVSGSQLSDRGRILTRMLADGDEIGNALSPGTSAISAASAHAELEATVKAIHAAVPLSPCLVRPPSRTSAAAVQRAAQGLGERVALWSLDPRDFDTTDPNLIAHRVLSQVRPGSIITLHDGGSDRWAIVQALPQILAGLARRGYRVTTVTNLYRTVLGTPSGAGRSTH
jgi:peptidoglycan/xylan/chitin deacetylase (PgdA/CDA1 family)